VRQLKIDARVVVVAVAAAVNVVVRVERGHQQAASGKAQTVADTAAGTYSKATELSQKKCIFLYCSKSLSYSPFLML
jgi:intracellular sulfur oxidation DsrE/DsrF family protein